MYIKPRRQNTYTSYMVRLNVPVDVIGLEELQVEKVLNTQTHNTIFVIILIDTIIERDPTDNTYIEQIVTNLRG